MKKILIFGGLHGSLTAAAEIISFTSNFCEGIYQSSTWDHLLDTFEFHFVPVVYPDLYIKSYESKTDGNKDQIVKKYSEYCNDFDEKFNSGNNSCGNYGFIKKNYDDYLFIINIQGTKNNYDSSNELGNNDKQIYIYDSVLGTRPKDTDGSFVSEVLKSNETYIFQYKHDLLSSINPISIAAKFEDEFEDIFSALGKTFRPPKVTFYNATENKTPSEKKPSNVTFMLAAWNTYPFSIEMSLQIDIEINQYDTFRVLDFTELQVATFSLYDDNEDAKYEPFTVIDFKEQNVSGDANKIWAYNLTVDRLKVPDLSYRGLKFIFTRTDVGQIKFDLYAKIASVGSNFFGEINTYEKKGQYVWLVPKEEDNNYAPRLLILFLMMIISMVIILVITCLVLVKK